MLLLMVVIMIILTVIYSLLAVSLAGLLVRYAHKIRLIQAPTQTAELADIKDLPTVSVCIPARNEMYTLSGCLDRVLQSDYPKLEILVLDDESDDDTSLLIKSYAHAGVRFIPGQKLPKDWLGKNFALDCLLRAASGKYVVFMDVDTRIDYQTISKAIATLEDSSVQLLSSLPHRRDTGRLSTIFGTLRYFWTLLFAVNEVTPASSSFWVVNRRSLLEMDGLVKYRLDSYPEMSLQSTLGMGMLVDSFDLGVSFEKRLSSQADTSIRLLKPLLAGYGLLVWLGLLFAAALPVVLVWSIWMSWWHLTTVATLAIVLAWIQLNSFYRLQWSSRRWCSLFVGPFVVLHEAYLLSMSYYRHAVGHVDWKGRRVKL